MSTMPFFVTVKNKCGVPVVINASKIMVMKPLTVWLDPKDSYYYLRDDHGNTRTEVSGVNVVYDNKLEDVFPISLGNLMELIHEAKIEERRLYDRA